MDSIFTPILALHITLGLTAVAVGFLPIFSTKGSRLHRLAGRVYVALTGVMLVCAWAMTVMHFSTYNAALSATASITLFSGVRVLGRKRPDLYRSARAGMLDWVMTVTVVGIGLWVLVLLLTGRSDGPVMVSAALVYAALLYGCWDLWRFVRPLDWPFSPELWRYEHLVKMLSAYGAVVSAFSGNFLTFLPAPWSQLWPSLLFQSLAVGWIVVLSRRRRGQDLAAA